jgi:hypothetical protein
MPSFKSIIWTLVIAIVAIGLVFRSPLRKPVTGA